MRQYRKIIISRTDSIGDVVLTLPVAGLLRKYHPEARILFLGQSYTRAVIESCIHIDEFIDWNGLSALPAGRQAEFLRNTGADLIIHVFPRREIALAAKKAGIPERMGTTGRLYHWYTCNRLVRLSRRNSPLHEAELNARLIARLLPGIAVTTSGIPALYGMERIKELPARLRKLIDPERFNLILHPKSKGSGREWGIDNFAKLTELLPHEKYNIFITGTEAEGRLLEEAGFFGKARGVTNLTGKMDLEELISFISAAGGLVASGTGPLHLAAALGRVAIGLFPPIRPIHPGRWAPLGTRATWLVAGKECNECKNDTRCECMLSIKPEEVKQKLESMVKP